MKKILLLGSFLLLVGIPAKAQRFSVPPPTGIDCIGLLNSSSVPLGQLCGAPKLKAGTGITLSKSANTVTITGSELSQDAITSGSNLVTVVGLNGTLLSGLSTGMLFNTTTTGVPSVWSDFTFSSHTGTLGASGILDLTSAAGIKPPAYAGGVTTTTRRFAIDTTAGPPHIWDPVAAADSTLLRTKDVPAITSPVDYAPALYRASSPATIITAASAGNAGAPLLSGGASAAGAYGPLNLAGGSNIVTGTLPLTNLPVRMHAFGGQFGSTDSGAAVLTTSLVRYTPKSEVACTIKNWTIEISPADTATVKFWRVAAGTALPTVSGNLNTSGVSISTGTLVESSVVTDFAVPSTGAAQAIAVGDVLAVTITNIGGTATFLSAQVGCQE